MRISYAFLLLLALIETNLPLCSSTLVAQERTLQDRPFHLRNISEKGQQCQGSKKSQSKSRRCKPNKRGKQDKSALSPNDKALETSMILGAWPNYFYNQSVDPKDEALMMELGSNTFVAYTDWAGSFQESKGRCAKSPEADQITSHLNYQVDFWSGEYGLNPYIVIPTHVYDINEGRYRIGPNCAPEWSQDSRELKRIWRLYITQLFETVKRYPNERWLISLGNEINLYIEPNQHGWSEYTDFTRFAATTIRQLAAEAGVSVTIGASTTWFGGSRVIDPVSGNTSASELLPFVTDLHKHLDSLFLTYYPYGGNDFWALKPETPWRDFAEMKDEATSIRPKMKVLLQEIGYSPNPKVHNQDPHSTIYSVWTNGEDAQNAFIFNALLALYTNQEHFEGMLWWSLADWDVSLYTPFCSGTWGSIIDSPGFRAAFCQTGLTNFLRTYRRRGVETWISLVQGFGWLPSQPVEK